MNIAIIGGGFTGLTAAYELLKNAHTVTVFEREPVLGGLAYGFTRPTWNWSLEYAYHHLFTNDSAIIGLIKELGLEQKLIIKRPITANYWNGAMYPFDTPKNLFQFPALSVVDKLRTASLAAFCKLNPFWQPLESMTAKDFAIGIGGTRAWKTIWEPLLVGKFGNYADTVAASWLWARIHKRTPSLCYIEGGFQTLINRLAAVIKEKGGKILTATSIDTIDQESGIWNLESGKKNQKHIHNSKFIIHNSKFDRVLLTVPTPIAAKLLPKFELSTINYQLSTNIPHLHAQTLILETKTPILNSVYWLNILDRSFPFLAAVAHTNFMDKKHYGGHHLTYFGNYLPQGHKYLKMTKEQLLKEFLPFIKRLNPDFKFDLSTINYQLFTGPFAQPVHELHYSQRAPKLQTLIPNLYLANMDSIYPWDRGTNYAMELGKRAAKAILSSRAI